MGFSGWELLIILIIVALLFGTKKLRNIGTDVGGVRLKGSKILWQRTKSMKKRHPNLKQMTIIIPKYRENS